MAQPQTTEPRKTLMRWIVGTSLNYRFLVVTIGALLMVFGVATLPSTRVDAFPEFAPPRVVIQTACLGLSTSDVEQLVTVPLEQALNGVEGLEDMRSKSVPQLSAIELIFKQGFDELKARQLVQERMTEVPPRCRRGQPAGHVGAGLGHRPGDTDRHDVEGPLTDPDVDVGLLDDPCPPTGSSRSRQRCACGASVCR
jgi:hypothetical protein